MFHFVKLALVLKRMAIAPNIILQCIIYLLSTICITSAIYGNHKLYEIRDVIFVTKRSKSILFGLNLALIINLLAHLLGYIAKIHFSHSLFVTITDILSATCYYLFLFFCITKSWMIYFKERWTFYTLQSQWQNVINPVDDKNKNWFIRKNYKYGSLSFMYKIFGIYHLISIIITIIAIIGYRFKFISSSITTPMAGLPFLFSTFLYVVIICKTHRLSEIDDIFYIHWESRIHSRLLLVLLIIFISHGFAEELIKNDILVISMFIPFYILNGYAMIHVSTYGIYKKNYSSVLPKEIDNNNITVTASDSQFSFALFYVSFLLCTASIQTEGLYVLYTFIYFSYASLITDN